MNSVASTLNRVTVYLIFRKDNTESQGFSDLSEQQEALMVEVTIPNCYKQAIRSRDASKWRDAMDKEINVMMERKVWDLVDHPDNIKILENRWVYTIKYTQEYKLELSKVKSLKLRCYSDSDFATNRDDRVSMGGFITFIDETPISWRTFKQKSVSLSTMEAEYVSLTEAAKEFIWLKNVIDNKSLNLELSENKKLVANINLLPPFLQCSVSDSKLDLTKVAKPYVLSVSQVFGSLETLPPLRCGGCTLHRWKEPSGMIHRFIVSRHWKQFETTGTDIRGFSSGRSRGTTPADDRYIVLQARGNRRQTAGEIARHTTQATGRPISRFTVARRLHGGGLFARCPVRCVPLTPAHRRRRSLWYREHRIGETMNEDEYSLQMRADSV
ncbi:retrovirus-related Pol polyprotein from transposon TNT 1-94 [Trichonephila clavipes]|nr:retrovirus-related Pol polyprotein from transposon TNT 1-94 [Trichonephila clavipes]